MSGIPGTVGRDWQWPRAPGRPKIERSSRWAGAAVPELALRAIAFFLLAFFAAAHWTALVEPNQTGRAFLVALIATSLGALLALSGRLPRPPGIGVRVLLLLVAALLSATAIGIRFKLLMPAHWDTLDDRISGGLSVLSAVTHWPYSGPNVWLRLTTLLAVPIVLVLAAAFTFWPRPKEARSVFRGLALVLIVSLYGVAVAARPFGHDALRGLGLLLCLAAWLWLPRLRGRDAVAAVSAVALAAMVALLLTPWLASAEPWVDYRHWSWSLNHEKTVAFDWQPAYGPLNWPRKGTTMMLVKATEPSYWRAETLDRFDGRGWMTAPNRYGYGFGVNGVVARNPKWIQDVHVTVRGLRSDVIIGPGSVLRVTDAPGQTVHTAFGMALTTGRLGAGDSYDVVGYAPEPTVKQMRAVPQPGALLERFTTIALPERAPALVSTDVHVPLRGQPATGDPGAAERLQRSRYARVYALAQSIAGGARTDYDIVRRIGSYLESNYIYSEQVPQRRYPIESFLLTDKRGYCQHFSGAAALMLRMLGVPVRVATGFAPGTLDKGTKEYVVRDLDAHSWIEVWFEGIGWVPFDPTPAAAPASSQAASFTPFSEAASAARGDTKDQLPAKLRDQLTGAGAVARGAGATAGRGTPWGWIAAGAAAATLAFAAIVVGLLRLRARRPPLPPPSGDAELDHLVRLLARAGLDIAPGTTLLELEQRMARLGGSDAAHYARLLRQRRFSADPAPSPDRADRRRLRQLLGQAIGAGPLTRLHLALPDNLTIRSGLLKLSRVQRPR